MEKVSILNNGQWVLSKAQESNWMTRPPQEHPNFDHYSKQATGLSDDMLHHAATEATRNLSSHLQMPGSPNHETTGNLRAMQHAYGAEVNRRKFPSKPVLSTPAPNVKPTI
jgi:hypothetical protein